MSGPETEEQVPVMPRGVDPNRRPFLILAAREVASSGYIVNPDHPLAGLPAERRQAAFEAAFVQRVRLQAELRLRAASENRPEGTSELEELRDEPCGERRTS